ncbi:MAG: cobalamin synthesis protein P47K [Deltaproteobacteria bacterium]|jgi:G3E family GTPase|nr:cobalamin synthesis protein P47K [Deltaproteobacteria bacterium]
MNKPRLLTVKKPVRLIFAGGFLGSGKTTALGAMARLLIRRGKKVGIITNDQSGNLTDTLVVRQMLEKLDVPVEEVVGGCFCCKFDELIDHVEKVLAHEPDILLGEPVGSCTDFVASVANPVKINYRDQFVFAPFSTMVDPDRVRELLFGETSTTFPEDVAYLFSKQLEEADLIVLNKIDRLGIKESNRIAGLLRERFPSKQVLPLSALKGEGLETWVEQLITGRPGAGTVLAQIDYDRYAHAEAVLGWLNAAVKITGDRAFNPMDILEKVILRLRDGFRALNAAIGHVKLAATTQGRSIWGNLVQLNSEPSFSDRHLGDALSATLLVNARVQMEPPELESLVRAAVAGTAAEAGVATEFIDLQCFSPAYPNPPYLTRES